MDVFIVAMVVILTAQGKSQGEFDLKIIDGWGLCF